MDTKYIFIYVALVVVFGIASIFISKAARKKANTQAETYLEKYPNAAKVYTKSGGFIISDKMTIFKVDGEYASRFNDKSGEGVYVKPGTVQLVCEYEWTRPGVMYKSVTKSTGEVSIEVEIKPKKNYILKFDKKTSQFTLDLITDEEKIEGRDVE